MPDSAKVNPLILLLQHRHDVRMIGETLYERVGQYVAEMAGKS